MDLGNTVQFNSLKWVKEELRLLLKEVQRQFELYLDNNDDADKLAEVNSLVRQVKGTLSLVEVYGAALLSEELEALLDAIAEGNITNKDDAHEAVLRAILQLADYLDSVAAGQKDTPILLLPLLNDLRAVRKENLLSESVLFVPDLNATASGSADVDSLAGRPEAQLVAKKLRPQYQFGLLGWFRGTDEAGGLRKMQKVLEHLRATARQDASSRLWWVSVGLLESIAQQGVDSSAAVKSLLGQVDRQIKALADLGEDSFAQQIPSEVIKNILYYVARSEAKGSITEEVKQEFRLAELMPSEGEGGQVAGVNEELLNTVSAAIKEDMHQAKDILDIHGPSANIDGLKALPEVLQKIADTLGMLGLGGMRERLVATTERLQIDFSSDTTDADHMMDAASTLLSAEDALDALVTTGSIEQSDKTVESDVAAENRKVVSTVVNEAQKGMTKAKEAIVDYMGDMANFAKMELVPALLAEVSGAMFVDPLDRAKPLLDGLNDFICTNIIQPRSIPAEAEQEAIADLVTSIEYYLEAVSENRTEGELYITVGLEALDRLSTNSVAEQIVVEAAPEEPESTVVNDAEEASELADIGFDLEELAADLTEPVVQAPAHKPKHSEPFERNLDIISDDVDEEILEIFIEELLEEHERISEQFPLWKQAPSNSDAITTIRRSFHTLKGSGRLVGAQLIGEFGWSMENLLNRMLDETIPLSEHVFNCVEETIGVLPQLIEQLTGNREPIESVYDLMARAWAVANGEDPDAEPEPEPEPEPEIELVQAEGPIDFDSESLLESTAGPIALAGDELGEVDFSVEEGPAEEAEESEEIDIFAESESFDLGEPEIIELADEPAIEITSEDVDFGLDEDEETPSFALSDDDMALDEESSEEHDIFADDSGFSADALNLEGSTASAGVELLTDLDDALDLGPGLDLEAEDLAEGDGADDSIELFILDEDEDSTKKSEAGDAAAESAETETVVIELPDLDPVLLEIYSGEALSHIETLDQQLAEHESNGQPLFNNKELTRSLHTLHGSSRTAEMHALADVARRLEYHGNDQDSIGEAWPQPTTALLAEAAVQFRAVLAYMGDQSKPCPDLVDLLKRIDPHAEVSAVRLKAKEEGLDDPHPEAAGEKGSAAPEDQSIDTAALIAADQTAEMERIMAGESEFYAVEQTVAEVDAPAGSAELEADTTIQVDPEDELVEIFIEEGEELVDECDATMQRWEDEGFDDSIVSQLQRQMHTLKGGARMAELKAMGDLSHTMEDVFDAIQSGKIENTESAMSTLRTSSDQLAIMLQEVKDKRTLTSSNALVAKLEAIRSGESIDEAVVANVDEVVESPPELEAIREESPPQDEPVELESVKSLTSKEFVAQLGAKDDVVDESSETVDSQEGEEELSIDLNDELVDIFLEEGEELVNACDNIMHDWAASEYKNSAHTEELQRQLHTLKGGARMANLVPLGDLSHILEEVILGVEKGALEVSPESAGAMTTAVDELATMLSQVRKAGKLRTANALIEKLERVRRGESLTELASKVEEDAERQEQAAEPVATEQIESISPADEQKPKDATTAPEKAPARVDENAQRFADTAAPAAMTGGTEQVRVRADKLDSLVNNAGEVSVYHSRIQQQLSNFGGSLNEYEQTIERIREQVRQVTNETDAQIDSRVERESDNPYENFDPLEMDRYSHMQQLARSLMESVNDLEDLRDTMNESVKDSETILHQQQRVSTDLQEGLMGTRMVHFEGVTSRLRRLVRQTAQQLNKKATITFTGTENEIDRSVQERMLAPLEHMLRNAVSHGIELPDVRTAKNKPAEGSIALTIGRDGSYIVMTLTDDGGGIDASIIRAKAIERGLMQQGEEKSDSEVMQYILQTGFSTAEQVTQISGRGVGMDVVSSEIKHLGGSLRIDSELGKGTTFTVRLPLTLAINQALMVMAQDDIFAIPLTAIEGVARLRGKELTEQYASERASHNYAGEGYDIYYLPTLLRMGRVGELNADEQYPLLLIRVGESRVAIHVDDLVGRREVVVKPVGRQVSTLPGVSGASILDDGRVALILEIGGLVQSDVVSLAFAQSDQVEEAAAEEDVRLTVMVVDDSITIRKVSARFLERNNYNVVTAKDGMDAVSQLEDFKPDIMLLDIEMPRMDGYEVATHVRNTKRLNDLPIIMITSRTGDKHRERAMEIGVNRYLGKPFQEAQLLGEINELMGTGE